MEVKIRETYVKCDICNRKIDRHGFYNHVHQMKVKNIEEKGLKTWYKIDMCHDCYDKIFGTGT